jgi:3-dehydroquinate dehydratase-2
MAELLVLNGPNLNLLGEREPQYYGTTTLAEIIGRLARQAESAGHRLQSYQSNAEHALVDRVQQAAVEGVAFIFLNPAGFTSTSVSLRDALTGTRIPFIEVHLSNVYAREPFRRQSYFSDVAIGVISGLGAQGYELALTFAIEYLKKSKKS